MATISKNAAAAAQLAEQCRQLYLPIPTHYAGGPNKELRFHPTRRWQLDVAWTNLQLRTRDPQLTIAGPKVALEIDGGVFLWRPCPRCKGSFGNRGCFLCKGAGQVQGGRHNTGDGYRDDVEKFSEAMILGWYLFRCLPEQIKAGETITFLERFFYAHHVVLPHSPRPRRSYPHDDPTTQKRPGTTERGNPLISTERGADVIGSYVDDATGRAHRLPDGSAAITPGGRRGWPK